MHHDASHQLLDHQAPPCTSHNCTCSPANREAPSCSPLPAPRTRLSSLMSTLISIRMHDINPPVQMPLIRPDLKTSCRRPLQTVACQPCQAFAHPSQPWQHTYTGLSVSIYTNLAAKSLTPSMSPCPCDLIMTIPLYGTHNKHMPLAPRNAHRHALACVFISPVLRCTTPFTNPPNHPPATCLAPPVSLLQPTAVLEG